ncbi:hypothetical protein CB1_000803034 [Camelus ferus]|nr:hypothetical protein CB1_000803034 [Camelus ferus]
MPVGSERVDGLHPGGAPGSPRSPGPGITVRSPLESKGHNPLSSGTESQRVARSRESKVAATLSPLMGTDGANGFMNEGMWRPKLDLWPVKGYAPPCPVLSRGPEGRGAVWRCFEECLLMIWLRDFDLTSPFLSKIDQLSYNLLQVETLHDFEAANSDELTLQRGDVVLVVPSDSEADQDAGWLVGVKESDWLQYRDLATYKGLFPENFTRRLD